MQRAIDGELDLEVHEAREQLVRLRLASIDDALREDSCARALLAERPVDDCLQPPKGV